jgi:hypothetical protein
MSPPKPTAFSAWLDPSLHISIFMTIAIFTR